MSRWSRSRNQDGFTFVELLVVTALVAILASAIMPLARVTAQREKEIELRRALREIRTAIDHYKDAADQGLIPPSEIESGTEGYPPDLETLVVGVEGAGQAEGKMLKFLRKVPIDPMTRSTEWGLLSYEDEPDARSWGGDSVYDIYTKSEGTALDGTEYRDW
jgi:general secretion pathway protein G